MRGLEADVRRSVHRGAFTARTPSRFPAERGAPSGARYSRGNREA